MLVVCFVVAERVLGGMLKDFEDLPQASRGSDSGIIEDQCLGLGRGRERPRDGGIGEDLQTTAGAW